MTYMPEVTSTVSISDEVLGRVEAAVPLIAAVTETELTREDAVSVLLVMALDRLVADFFADSQDERVPVPVQAMQALAARDSGQVYGLLLDIWRAGETRVTAETFKPRFGFAPSMPMADPPP